MYTIKVDGNLLYDPFIADQGYSVLNPKITYEMNKAGSLELIVPPNNVNIGAIHKLKSIVQVFDNGKEIFRGRVLHDETDFYKRKSVYCEGELAFLLDSIVRSYDYQGNFDGLFTQLIENHNSQVDDDKKFIVGEITVKDKNDYIHYSSTQYPTTWDEINEKLIKTHGGYLRTRLENGNRYIDYIDDYKNVSNQVIEFGKNMIDLTEYMSAEDIFTVLIPIGSEIKDESGETSGRVTIESVNEGNDYIQDDNAIALFGKIVKTQKWDSVSQPDNLLYKAREYLASGVQMATTITIKAVNLNILDVNIDSIKLGDYCRVISKPHGLDKMFQCSKIVIDLTNPQNSVYTFGLNLKSMTDIQIDNDSDMKEIIENTSESNKSEFDQKITDAKQAFKDEIAEAVKKINGGTSGHVVLVLNDKGETNELYAFDGDSLLTAKKLLRLNYEGIAGTDEGYNGDFKLAISTDGKINAEQIVTGIIRDALGRNFWNLDTGEFKLQAIDNMLVGSTNLINGTINDTYITAGGNNEEYFVVSNDLEQGQPYILSFEATSSDTNQVTVRNWILYSGSVKEYTVDINNGRSYVYINASESYPRLEIFCGIKGQTSWKSVKLHHIMLEKGTVPSDWSPSPDDVMSTVSELSQEDIFNKLTNNGQTQGLYLQNGKIYLNLEYLVSNIIKGLSIFGSTITFGDQNDTYRVQASYKESSTSYEGYVPRGVTFETFDSGASVQHITDKFLVTSYTNRSHNMLFLQEGTFSQLRSKKPDGSSEAWVSASTVHDDPGVLLSVEKGTDILNTLYVGTDEIYLAVDYLKNILSFKSGGKLALLGKYNSEQYSITSIDGNGNIVYKTQRNNFLQACDGSGNVKAYLQMYSNGQAWLSSDGQMVVQGYGKTFIKSIGNGVYLQSRNSDDNADIAKLYLQNDGKVYLSGSLNKNTYINGYPAVRINGTYHDIFFQWNGASLIATVDVTQVWSTSDRRLKDHIEKISDSYIDAIGSAEIKQFIFTDEIYDQSIKHFGVIAQDIREALEAKGINPEEIAVNNHFDRDGTEYYGIDKDEFYMARIAYDEKKIKMLEERIEKLEKLILKES